MMSPQVEGTGLLRCRWTGPVVAGAALNACYGALGIGTQPFKHT